ncbi:RNA polymerase sigma factor [Candidatus Entotheonella palauensis]|uniref:RNA polymerase sigma factor n=1 Tax=Candidatus Entotheonella palauensis TaxID=93172 RepID=UPI0015C41196|nr:sigma-70 family RNA polymerase sigma factor [Candidatus Entotheonella palauensis]
MHEQELPTALAADLESNFERLVELYQHRLYAFALRLIGNPHDAEEIVVDAMVRAYQALGQYEAGRIEALELRPWLYQITLNVFRNRVRGRRLSVVSYDQPEGPRVPNIAGDRAAQPEAALERSELRDTLVLALAKLPERERIAVTLRHVQGVAYGDIAVILEQPVGTVKANVHRGVRRLRQVLSDDFAWR